MCTESGVDTKNCGHFTDSSPARTTSLAALLVLCRDAQNYSGQD
jgi:hypothetical protein